jgi:hypothetical protein
MRTAATVAAAGLVVAGTVWAVNVRGHDRTIEPVEPLPENPGSIRPLTYADGTTLHYGDRAITLDEAPSSIEVTDFGVAYTTADGGVWFTDGEKAEQIGTTDLTSVTAWLADSLVGQATGPDVEWFEDDGSGGVDVVVYDTRTRAEVGRVPTGVARDCEGECAEIYGFHDNRLYWTDQPCHDCMGFPPTKQDESKGDVTPTTRQTDVTSGEEVVLSSPEFRAVVRGWPRVIELRQGNGEPMDETSDDYLIGEGIGLQIGGWPQVEVYGPAPGELVRFVVATDEPVQFRGSGRLPTEDDFRLVQWLDDDSVALAQYRFNRDFTRVRYSLLVVCHFSGHTCEVAAPAPDSGSREVPGV